MTSFAAPSTLQSSSFDANVVARPVERTQRAATAGASLLASLGAGLPAFASAASTDRSALAAGAQARPGSNIEAARFLTQATLGFNADELDALLASSSYGAWLQAQYAMPRSRSHFDWLTDNGYADPANIFSTKGLDNSIWRKLIESPDALRQRVTLALSEICVVSVLGVNSPWRQFAVGNYLDILEANAFGNYRTLLEQITLSPAMGYYLTYRGNTKADPASGSEPDENYARELMQLFTIGLVALNPDGSVRTTAGKPVESYGQADVSGLARVFTGWDLDRTGYTSPLPPLVLRRPMTQAKNRYETGAKTFLGTTIAANTSASDALAAALDTLFKHPNLPPFIGKQMIQRLVTSNPSPAYVARVAGAFANNGQGVRGDMQALISAVLLDPEARQAAQAAAPRFGKLREPVVRMLNWARAFKLRSTSNTWAIGDLSSPSTGLGQSPMRSPSVFNFFRPGYVPPGTVLASSGLCAPEFQLATEVSVAGYVNFMQRMINNSFTGDLIADYSDMLAVADDAGALLTGLNTLLAAGALPAATLARMRTGVESISTTSKDWARNRVSIALLLVLAAPEYIVQK